MTEGYDGPARLLTEDRQVEVQVSLRGAFQPIDGRYHWYGRLARHEVMSVSEEIERLAVERASATAIETVAKEQGMKTLRDDGMAKVLAGVTSLDEIFRVVV